MYNLEVGPPSEIITWAKTDFILTRSKVELPHFAAHTTFATEAVEEVAALAAAGK